MEIAIINFNTNLSSSQYYEIDYNNKLILIICPPAEIVRAKAS